jgi:hypothetical protein
MAHTHGVYDGDTHFEIDPITRRIKNTTGKVILMQNDHNSERFTFEMQRTNDGHDMSLCNKVEVHYINIDAKTKEQTSGVYPVEDLQISEASDDVIICSWLISQNATKYAGTLSFVVRFACVTDGIIDYQWFTDIHKGISVCESISNGEAVLEEYADILAQWEERITALENDDFTGSLVVKYNSTTKTASHSASEINAFLDTGGIAVLVVNKEYCAVKTRESNSVCFYREHTASGCVANFYYVQGDKSVITSTTYYDYGTVKSVNYERPDSDGNIELEIPKTYSWNDLTDNPFVASEVILEERTILASEWNADGHIKVTYIPQLSIGEFYNVIVNGVSHRCEVVDDLTMGNTIIWPVNGEASCPLMNICQWYDFVGDEDVFTGRSDFYVNAVDWDSFTLSITKDMETLNEKYLPYKTESWTFELSDGTTVEKQVVLK